MGDRVKIAAIVASSSVPRALPLVAAVLAVAIVASHVRVVAGGQTWADARYHTEVAPPRLAAAEAVQRGAWPAWWEGSGLGVPLAAEPSHGALYAPGWIAATPRALDLLAIAHLFWAALGVAVWARRRAALGGRGAGGASEPAAVAVALLAATSGLLASAAVRGALPALAHLPWIGAAAAALAAAEDARARQRAGLALAALVGLVATSGVHAVLIDALVLAVALAARRRAAVHLAAALAVGLALGAVQWLPALAQIAAGETAGGETSGLRLARLVELIVPGAFGASDPARGVAALAGAAPWAPSLFVGAPLLALAAVRTPSRRLLGAIGALAALALVWGRGGWPLWLGAPELHAAALVLVLAASAGAGLDALLAGERRALLSLGTGLACAAVALGAVGLLRVRHPEAAGAIDRALLDGGLGLVSMGLALALARRAGAAGGGKRAAPLALVLLLVPSAGAMPSTGPLAARDFAEEPPAWARAAAAAAQAQAPPPGAVAAPRRVFRPVRLGPGEGESAADAVATLAGAAGWRWGAGAARSEDPARPRAHDAAWLAAAHDGGALLDRFGISLAILPATIVVPRALEALAVRGDWALTAFPAAPPASVMGGAVWAIADEDALALLFPQAGAPVRDVHSHAGERGAGEVPRGAPLKLPRGTVVLRGRGPARSEPAGSGPALSGPASRGAGPPRPCAIQRWDAGALELLCDGGAAGGYAVVSSTAARGWSVTIDGAPAPWLVADVLRRAVPLPPGAHAVRWTYEAPLQAAGLWAALAGLAALAAGLAGLFATRPRDAAPQRA